MAIHINDHNKITDIFINVNGSKKRITHAWVHGIDSPKKVFGVSSIVDDPYDVAPADAYNNWNYTLDDINNTITLNYYIGSETDVIVYASYVINNKQYKTKLSSNVIEIDHRIPYMFNSYGNVKCRNIK